METQWGDEVRVVGSRPELGNWGPELAVALRTSAETYPAWSGEVQLDLREFHYKFIKVAPCGKVTWEEGGNRQFRLFAPSAMPVDLIMPHPLPASPKMQRRGSTLPSGQVQELPTLLAHPASPPVFL